MSITGYSFEKGTKTRPGSLTIGREDIEYCADATADFGVASLSDSKPIQPRTYLKTNDGKMFRAVGSPQEVFRLVDEGKSVKAKIMGDFNIEYYENNRLVEPGEEPITDKMSFPKDSQKAESKSIWGSGVCDAASRSGTVNTMNVKVYP